MILSVAHHPFYWVCLCKSIVLKVFSYQIGDYLCQVYNVFSNYQCIKTIQPQSEATDEHLVSQELYCFGWWSICSNKENDFSYRVSIVNYLLQMSEIFFISSSNQGFGHPEVEWIDQYIFLIVRSKLKNNSKKPKIDFTINPMLLLPYREVTLSSQFFICTYVICINLLMY